MLSLIKLSDGCKARFARWQAFYMFFSPTPMFILFISRSMTKVRTACDLDEPAFMLVTAVTRLRREVSVMGETNVILWLRNFMQIKTDGQRHSQDFLVQSSICKNRLVSRLLGAKVQQALHVADLNKHYPVTTLQKLCDSADLQIWQATFRMKKPQPKPVLLNCSKAYSFDLFNSEVIKYDEVMIKFDRVIKPPRSRN